MTRSERLLALLDIMRRYRYPVTAARLSEELRVSQRTIYRDIATLQSQGARIEGEAGVGFILKPGFMLPPLMFTEEELEALVLGSRWVASRTDAPLAEAAHSALSKIAAGIPSDLGDKMFGTPLLVAPGVPREDEDRNLSLLRGAIRRGIKVMLDYRDSEGRESSRIIWPFGLAFFDHARVILAYCEKRGSFRHFRIDRIRTCSMIEMRFPRSKTVLLREWRDMMTAECQAIKFTF